MECVVLIIAFSIQFDLVPDLVALPSEATAWSLSILVAAIFDFFLIQPIALGVISVVTVYTTQMYKGDYREEDVEEEVPAAPLKKKKSSRKEARRRARKEARKQLTVTVGTTRGGRNEPTATDDYMEDDEIKTKPVTLGRTRGGGMREMRMSHDSGPLGRGRHGTQGRSQNFLIDGEEDTKRMRDSRVYDSASEQSHVTPASPSSSNTFVTASSSVPSVAQRTPRSHNHTMNNEIQPQPSPSQQRHHEAEHQQHYEVRSQKIPVSCEYYVFTGSSIWDLKITFLPSKGVT